jgi:hypothetical protein
LFVKWLNDHALLILSLGCVIAEAEPDADITFETLRDPTQYRDRGVEKVPSLIDLPLKPLGWVAVVSGVDDSTETLREVPSIDEDRSSDHVAVEIVPLTVAKEESVDDAVGELHNWIIAETSETAPDSVTGTGVCTARATSDASLTYKDAFVSVTLLFAATEGASVLLFDQRMSGRGKRHWYKLLERVTAMMVVPFTVAPLRLLETTPTQVPAHSSVEASEIRISVTAGLDPMAAPISRHPAAAGGLLVTPSNMSTIRAAALTAMDARASGPETLGTA